MSSSEAHTDRPQPDRSTARRASRPARVVTLMLTALALLVGLLVVAPTPASAQSATRLRSCHYRISPCGDLQPVVAANPNTDVKTVSTIVITGSNLPVAPRRLIGTPTLEWLSVLRNGVGIGGIAGDGWGITADCHAVIGESTSNRLVIAVGEAGAVTNGVPDPSKAVVVRTAATSNPQAFWFGGFWGLSGWYGVASTNFSPHPTIGDAWVV